MAIIDNLISYYKLDEVAGNALDAHNGNDGIVTGATQGVAGKINTAYDFDGNEDYVNVGSFLSGITWSISFWFNADNTNDAVAPDSRIYMIGNDQPGWNDDVLIGIAPETAANSTTKRIAAIHQDDDTTTRTIVEDIVDAIADTWYHVVVTSDGNDLKLYVNGSLKDTTPKQGNDLNFNLFTIYFGENVGGGNLGDYDGVLDEIGIWNRALTGPEVTGLWNDSDGLAYPFVPVGTNMQLNISDVLKDISEIKINIGGVLKDVTEAKINIGDVLKDVF